MIFTMRKDADLLIIGGGPAGLAAAQYGARANLDVLVIEQFSPGGQALNIGVLENYPGIAEETSGQDFSLGLKKQAERFGARFFQASVQALKKEGDLFTAHCDDGGEKCAPAVIVATGTSHRALDIPGEKEFAGRGVSYCAACDGPFFKNRKIIVAGGGDSACDGAEYLSRLSPKIILVHRREKFRAQAALAERVLKNPDIEVRFNTRLREIQGETSVTRVIMETEGRGQYEEDAAAVFVFAGAVPQASFCAGLDIEKDESGYLLTDQNMAAKIPGLFVAGDVRATPFRQVVVAAGEGAVAAHSAAAYLDALRGMAYR
jgi:thioredoxin reductase (NADPH)